MNSSEKGVYKRVSDEALAKKTDMVVNNAQAFVFVLTTGFDDW